MCERVLTLNSTIFYGIIYSSFILAETETIKNMVVGSLRLW